MRALMSSAAVLLLLVAAKATPSSAVLNIDNDSGNKWWQLDVHGVDNDDHRVSYIASDGKDKIFMWGMTGSQSIVDHNATWLALNASCPPTMSGCSTVLWNVTSQLQLNYQDNYWSAAPLYLPESQLAVFPTQDESGNHDGVYLHAFDASSGAAKWVYHRPHCKGLIPEKTSLYKVRTVDGEGDLIVYYNCGSVIAVNGSTGVVQWQASPTGTHASGFNQVATPDVSFDGSFAASVAGGFFGNCGLQVYQRQSSSSYKPSWSTSVKVDGGSGYGCLFQNPAFSSFSSSSRQLVIHAIALGSTELRSARESKICSTSAPYFCQFNISAFDASSGALVWTTIQDAYYHYELVQSSEGGAQLVVVGNNQTGAGSPHAVVINASNGKVSSKVFLTSKFSPTEPGPNYEGRLQKVTPVTIDPKTNTIIGGFYSTEAASPRYYRKGFIGVSYQTGEVAFELNNVTYIHLPEYDYRYQYQGNIALLEAGQGDLPSFATQMGQRGFYYNGTVFVASP